MAYKREYDEEKKKYLIAYLKDYIEYSLSNSYDGFSYELFENYIELACSLSSNSDYEKIKTWDVFNNLTGHYFDMLLKGKKSIIASLDSDYTKERLWNDSMSFAEKLLVAKSTKSEKRTLDLLIKLYNEVMEHMIEHEDQGAEIVARFASSEFREFLATKVFNFSNKTIEKYRLSTKSQKEFENGHIDSTGYLDVDYVIGLHSNEEKIKLLDEVCYHYRYKVIASLPPLEIYDEIKKDYLREKGGGIHCIDESFEVILSLSDKEKVIFLEETIEENESYINMNNINGKLVHRLALIIASFQSSELKQKYMKYVKQEQNQLIVVASLGYYSEKTEPTDVITTIGQLDDSTRKELINIVKKIWEYRRDKLEEDGWKYRENMIKAREKIDGLVSLYTRSQNEEESIVNMLENSQKKSTNGGER